GWGRTAAGPGGPRARAAAWLPRYGRAACRLWPGPGHAAARSPTVWTQGFLRAARRGRAHQGSFRHPTLGPPSGPQAASSSRRGPAPTWLIPVQARTLTGPRTEPPRPPPPPLAEAAT